MLILLLLLSFITWGMLALSSCGGIQDPVTISDETIYVVKGNPLDSITFPTYAVQFQFLTSGQTDLTKDNWDALFSSPTSGPRVAMSLNAWDDFNTEFGKLCTQVPCNYATTQQLAQLFAKLTTATGHKFKYTFQ